ncbi:MAG: dephospho-CoA kinase [Acidobacteria bacterium]|nr:dephospho-CoA kinase [Acidobacteriota bacterium]MBI3661440.1 dephospho-CoA kinase [Acidobacteriota bacterium]
MLRVGLTGGIGCGKSTVAAMMRELGCHVIEADPLAHQLMEPGRPAYQEILREFGSEILQSDGRVDRAKLGAMVFSGADKLLRLNAILHPRVLKELERQFSEFARANPAGVAVVEAALLIEAGYVKHLERLVVAWCRPEQQMERLLARGMPREQIEQRIAAQMPLEEKSRRADDVVDCSGSLEETRAQVERLVARLKQLAAA